MPAFSTDLDRFTAIQNFVSRVRCILLSFPTVYNGANMITIHEIYSGKVCVIFKLASQLNSEANGSDSIVIQPLT